VPGSPQTVWPWLVQLGKRRAGWYLPRQVERIVPRSRRAIRRIDPQWQCLEVGDIIPDYGGRDGTFEVAWIEPRVSLVYTSLRGRTHLSWSITLEPLAGSRSPCTRVFLRLRLAPVRHLRLANTVGEFFDVLTVAGMAAGLRNG
jgi:hypothetical protein